MKFILTIFMMLIGTVALASSKPVASLSSNEIVMGDTVSLSISFEYNGDEDPYVSFDPVNAEIIDDNRSNGATVSVEAHYFAGKIIQRKKYHFTYILQPVRSGYIHIRNIKIDLGTKVLKHRSLKLRVLHSAKKMPKYFVRVETNKNTLYIGEGVDVKYYLYFKGEIASPDVRRFPKLNNFLKRFELPKVQVERISLSGEIYKRLLIYKARAYPEKEGNLTLDPIDIVIQYPQMRRGRRDVFGMSMMFSSGSYKRKQLKSKRKTISVMPIPTENMPKNFTGLVGVHDFKLSFSQNSILVNDIAEARLEVTGEGALEKMDAPQILNTDSFEEFDTKSEIIELGDLKNKKVFDYTFLAKKSDMLPAKKVNLSYFDPEKKVFVQIEIDVPQLKILGAGTRSHSIESRDSKKVDTIISNKEQNKESFLAPLKTSVITSILNYKFVNWALILFIMILLISDMRGTLFFNKGDQLKKLKKQFKYNQIYGFLMSYCRDGETVREMLVRITISDEASNYLNEILDKAERNEYKGSMLKLDFKQNYFEEIKKINK